jgi:hypothetical protein
VSDCLGRSSRDLRREGWRWRPVEDCPRHTSSRSEPPAWPPPSRCSGSTAHDHPDQAIPHDGSGPPAPSWRRAAKAIAPRASPSAFAATPKLCASTGPVPRPAWIEPARHTRLMPAGTMRTPSSGTGCDRELLKPSGGQCPHGVNEPYCFRDSEMSTPAPKPPKRPRPPKLGATYRGVALQATGGSSRYSIDQIRRAVKAAVEKNADALARRT